MIRRIKRKIVMFYKTKIKKLSIEQIKQDNYRRNGIKIGNGCIFCSDLPIGRDSCLLEFGDEVLISVDVKFLMHDAAPTVVSNGKWTDILGKVKIGNKCFIGANSVIMPGVTLADSTVVGAGSIVTHSVNEPGYVIAGNPARVVCSVEEYLSKNKDKIVNLNGMNANDINEYFLAYPEKLLSKKSL